ncbi:thioredoxin domain-containing protein [Sphingomonas sp. LaA6.9]|uniref:DsbA family protein n=1 Tax=Sphingomonas sp. LaA6.9 TaxID=2919914 RepID=UPI001F4FA89C|nr:thioredoxin domain-containing protein [Sphingomonas sp. LaA6.9]MCJ8157966.1 DsbA family protein [Sphingomonas sp. LaA6.9]
MKRIFGLTALSLTLALAACGSSDDAKTGEATSSAAPIAAPAGQNWADSVTQTEDGGFLMGNPNAPVKLVEYASLTCSHCAEFAEKGVPALKEKYISKGTVSLEVRNYVRDPIDMTAALLSRCGGAGPYFQLTEQMFGEQAEWMNRYQSLGEAGFQRIQSLPPAQQFAELAKAGQLDQFVQQRGVSSQKAGQCLADKAAVDKLVAMNKKATEEYGLTGTPMFMINGQVVPDTAAWEALEPKLRAAGA